LRQRRHIRVMQESHQLSGSDLPHARQRAPLRFTFASRRQFSFQLRQRPWGTGIPIASTQRIKGRSRIRSN
jgi:hypothetical protein